MCFAGLKTDIYSLSVSLWIWKYNIVKNYIALVLDKVLCLESQKQNKKLFCIFRLDINNEKTADFLSTLYPILSEEKKNVQLCNNT